MSTDNKHNEQETEQILDRAIEQIRNEEVNPAVEKAAAERVWAKVAEERAGASIHGCADFQALLPDYRAAKLSEAKRLLVADHLRECIACRKVAMGGHAAEVARPVSWALPQVWRWAIAAALVLMVASASLYLFNQYGPAPDGPAATVASLDGSLYRMVEDAATPLATGETILAGETVRVAKGTAASIRLRDGSEVELRERSDFTIGETRRDVTIRLARGSVIVEAAKRDSGHLYVSTRDCRVAVTGTVFSVNSGVKGSRVSVIEGSVLVAQGGAERALRPGEQHTSNANLAAVPMSQEIAWSQNADQHLALLTEFQVLAERMDREVQLPDVRYSSALVDHLPANTAVFAALPNLGETLAQAYEVLQQQMEQSERLRAWWEELRGKQSGPSVEQMIDHVRRVASYLGDEIVIAAGEKSDGKLGDPVFLATVKQSGFPEFVQAELGQLGEVDVQVFSSAAAITPGNGEGVLLYVQGDKVAISPSAEALRAVAVSIEGGGTGFTTTPLYSRIMETYRAGAGMLVSADLERITASEPDELAVLGNIQHIVAGQKQINGKLDTRAMITFTGQRQGLVGLLAAPSPIGALDFISPEAAMVSAAAVNDPVGVLDELISKVGDLEKELEKAETELGISVRDDLAAAIGGEFAFAIDGPVVPVPSWKLVVEVYNPGLLATTVERLVDSVNRMAAQNGKPGVTLSRDDTGQRTYYTLVAAEGTPLTEAHYTFIDGYLVAAPSRALIESAISNRAARNTLVTSAQFNALVPRDEHANFSAMVYHNVAPTLQPLAQVLSEEQRQALEGLDEVMKPTLVVAYGAEDRITMATSAEAFGLTPSNFFGMRMPASLQGVLRDHAKGQKQ
ncbi:MAG: hypothetical protein GY953_39670 [bacterium]|nr:hypothetical protein [bacterium]